MPDDYDNSNIAPRIKAPTLEIEEELAEMLEAGIIYDTGERQLDLETGKLIPVYACVPDDDPVEEELTEAASKAITEDQARAVYACDPEGEELTEADFKAVTEDLARAGLLRDTGKRKIHPKTGEPLVLWEITEKGRQVGEMFNWGKRNHGGRA
jgi:hypothetical protein